MKRSVYLLFLISIMGFSQVGINTTNPGDGSILDISGANKGLLIPRVNIANKNTIAPITDGETESLLVYNTNAFTGKGFYFWDGDSWVEFIDKNIFETEVTQVVHTSIITGVKSVKYSTDSNSQDLNNNSYTKVKLFDTLEWNDDTDVYEYKNINEITIKETGRYLIRVNLGLEIDDDLALQLRIAVNGTGVGSTYISPKSDNEGEYFSIHLGESIELQANDLVSIMGRRSPDSSGSEDIRLDNDSDSYVQIIRIN